MLKFTGPSASLFCISYGSWRTPQVRCSSLRLGLCHTLHLALGTGYDSGTSLISANLVAPSTSEEIALAAKLRVFHFEPHLLCDQWHSEIADVFATDRLHHNAWSSWCNDSHVLVLARAREKAEALGTTKESVWPEFAQLRRSG